MTRFASYQVCDQVAQGGLGKFAFVGLYGSEILVPTLPFTLEQLFFIVRFRATVDDLPTRLLVRIERPGHEPFVVDQTDSLPKQFNPKPDITFFDAQAIVRLAPFVVEAEGTVKIFVEDERGDNYAGGLRLRVGVHPDVSLPAIATSAVLAVGQYHRTRETAANFTQQTSVQLMEALSKLVASSGQPRELQYPDADMRLVVDPQRIQVFFPRPLETERVVVTINPSPSFEYGTVETVDQIGFVARFEPNAPPDASFDYSVEIDDDGVAEALKTPSRQKAKRSKKT